MGSGSVFKSHGEINMTKVSQNKKGSKMDKSIIRTVKNAENPFVMIDRRIFENDGLSLKAKGLLGYLLSRPDNWTICMADLVKRTKDGKASVRSAMEELENCGYVTKVQLRDGNLFNGYEYTVHELPLNPVNSTVDRKMENHNSVNQKKENQKSDTNNNDFNNKEYNEKEKAQPQNSDGFIVSETTQQPTQEVTESMIDDAIAHLVMQKLLNPFELFNREAIRFELINSQQYKKPAKITLANFIKSLPVDERIARFQTLAQSEIIHPSHIASAPVIDDAPKLSREEKLARIAQIERGEI